VNQRPVLPDPAVGRKYDRAVAPPVIHRNPLAGFIARRIWAGGGVREVAIAETGSTSICRNKLKVC
jgi:hypothetical protein